LKYKSIAEEVVVIAKKNAANVLTSMHTMASLYPALGAETAATLPYLALHDFEVFGADMRDISHSSVIAFLPLLKTMEEMMKWNNYTNYNQEWIETGRAIQSAEEVKAASEITPYVWKYDDFGKAIPETYNTLYAPVWQLSPVPEDLSIVNFNVASKPEIADLITKTLVNGGPVLSKPFAVEDVFGSAATLPEGEESMPQSILLQPVFSSLLGDAVVAGNIAAVIPWKTFFDNVSATGNFQNKDEIQELTCFLFIYSSFFMQTRKESPSWSRAAASTQRSC
jgi:hypothetical protein